MVAKSGLQIVSEREMFRMEILQRGRIGLLIGLFLSTALGVLISVNAESVLLLGFFLVAQALGIVVGGVRNRLPFWFPMLLPIAHFMFILIAAYMAKDPILAGLFLFEYVLFNTLTQPFAVANIWSTLTVFGYLFMVWLNPNEAEESVSLSLAYITVAAVTLVVSYVVGEVLSNAADEHVHNSRKAEEASARYDVLLNSIGDGLVITDKAGFIQFVNRRALDLLGADREQLLGQPMSAVILMQSPDGAPLRHSEYPVVTVLETGERLSSNMTSRVTYQIVRNDNSAFPVSLSVSPVQLLGTVDGAVVLFNDSTDFEEMEKVKSEFVSLASHQLRTPLNVVSWYAEKLLSQRKGALNTRQLDYVREIHTNNNRMIKLVSDLLNVSRVDLGRRKRKHQSVDLTRLMGDLKKEIEPLLDEKNIDMTTLLPDKQIIFRDSDESMLTVIVQNLLSNALKYTSEGGAVSLQVHQIHEGDEIDPARRLKAEKAGALIVVADSGIGIPATQQDQVFSRLFRADNVQSLDVEGTGLGLYVTHSFVRMLDGDIWFESEEGKGTKFFVYLPS